MLVSTRAFFVDDYLEDCMIPFADLFNHEIDEDVHMETIVEVCISCGDVGCGCDLMSGVEFPAGQEDEKSKVNEKNQTINLTTTTNKMTIQHLK